jgi:WD40 repeat protein/ankyrin repeat protein
MNSQIGGGQKLLQVIRDTSKDSFELMKRKLTGKTTYEDRLYGHNTRGYPSDPNTKEKQTGKTALMIACEVEQFEKVKLLLEQPTISITLLDNENKSVLQYAKGEIYNFIYDFIIKHIPINTYYNNFFKYHPDEIFFKKIFDHFLSLKPNENQTEPNFKYEVNTDLGDGITLFNVSFINQIYDKYKSELLNNGATGKSFSYSIEKQKEDQNRLNRYNSLKDEDLLKLINNMFVEKKIRDILFLLQDIDVKRNIIFKEILPKLNEYKNDFKIELKNLFSRFLNLEFLYGLEILLTNLDIDYSEWNSKINIEGTEIYNYNITNVEIQKVLVNHMILKKDFNNAFDIIFREITNDDLRSEKIKDILPSLEGNFEYLNKEYHNKQILFKYSIQVQNIDILKFLLKNNVNYISYLPEMSITNPYQIQLLFDNLIEKNNFTTILEFIFRNYLTNKELYLEKIKQILPLLKGNFDILNYEYNKLTLFKIGIISGNIEFFKLLLEYDVKYNDIFNSIPNVDQIQILFDFMIKKNDLENAVKLTIWKENKNFISQIIPLIKGNSLLINYKFNKQSLFSLIIKKNYDDILPILLTELEPTLGETKILWYILSISGNINKWTNDISKIIHQNISEEEKKRTYIEYYFNTLSIEQQKILLNYLISKKDKDLFNFIFRYVTDESLKSENIKEILPLFNDNKEFYNFIYYDIKYKDDLTLFKYAIKITNNDILKFLLDNDVNYSDIFTTKVFYVKKEELLLQQKILLNHMLFKKDMLNAFEMIFSVIEEKDIELEKIMEILPFIDGNKEIIDKVYSKYNNSLLKFAIKNQNIYILNFLLKNNVNYNDIFTIEISNIEQQKILFNHMMSKNDISNVLNFTIKTKNIEFVKEILPRLNESNDYILYNKFNNLFIKDIIIELELVDELKYLMKKKICPFSFFVLNKCNNHEILNILYLFLLSQPPNLGELLSLFEDAIKRTKQQNFIFFKLFVENINLEVVNNIQYEKKNMMHYAIIFNDIKSIKILIEKKIDIFDFIINSSNIVYLLKNGINIFNAKKINSKNIWENIFDYINTFNEATIIEIINILIEKNDFDNLLLLLCSTNKYPNEYLVQTLENPKLFIDHYDNTGKNAVIHLIKNNMPDKINLLFTNHINVNAQDNDGNTALHWAIYRDYIESITELCDNPEIIPFIPNNSGHTALTLSIDKPYKGMIDITKGITIDELHKTIWKGVTKLYIEDLFDSKFIDKKSRNIFIDEQNTAPCSACLTLVSRIDNCKHIQHGCLEDFSTSDAYLGKGGIIPYWNEILRCKPDHGNEFIKDRICHICCICGTTYGSTIGTEVTQPPIEYPKRYIPGTHELVQHDYYNCPYGVNFKFYRMHKIIEKFVELQKTLQTNPITYGEAMKQITLAGANIIYTEVNKSEINRIISDIKKRKTFLPENYKEFFPDKNILELYPPNPLINIKKIQNMRRTTDVIKNNLIPEIILYNKKILEDESEDWDSPDDKFKGAKFEKFIKFKHREYNNPFNIKEHQDVSLDTFYVMFNEQISNVSGKFFGNCILNPNLKECISYLYPDELKIFINNGFIIDEKYDVEVSKGHTDKIQNMCIIDKKYFVTASADTKLIIWNLETAEPKVLTDHTNTVNSVVSVGDNKHIVSGSDDNNLIIWNLEDNSNRIIPQQYAVKNMCALGDQENIIFYSNNHLYLHNIVTNTQSDLGEFLEIKSITTFGDKQKIIILFDEKSQSILDKDGKEIDIINQKILILNLLDKTSIEINHDNILNKICILEDQSRIIGASNDKTLIIWDAKTGNKINTLVGHTGNIKEVISLGDNIHILSFSYRDDSIRIWNVNDGKNTDIIKSNKKIINNVLAINNTQIIYSLDEKIKLYDLSAKEIIKEYKRITREEIKHLHISREKYITYRNNFYRSAKILIEDISDANNYFISSLIKFVAPNNGGLLDLFKEKYLKYKAKYLALKKLSI